MLTVIEALPVKTVQELLEYARRNPGTLNYGSAGPGSGTHLAMALFTFMTGTSMTHVPYRGSAPVGRRPDRRQSAAGDPDHVGGAAARGRRQASAAGGVDHQAGGGAAGRCRPSRRAAFRLRHRALDRPARPPPNTPPAIVARLNAAAAEVLASPDLKDLLLRQGAEQTGGTPAQFAEEIKRELTLWRELVKQTGIRVD